MSYSFSIVGDTPDENTEWNLITDLAGLLKEHQGVVSATGNTQYHGVVDLTKVGSPSLVVVSNPNNQEVTPVTDTPTPEPAPTTPEPEPSTTVTADDEAREVEPELNEAGEVVGFKEPGSSGTVTDLPTVGISHEVLDPEGEVVGHEATTTSPPKEEA